MSNLHKEFSQFHESIKLGSFEEESTLREKRDTLLANLKDRLPENFPSLTSFNQGSYAMGTGNKPLDGDYDIDVGIILEAKPEEYQPVEIKKMVRDALQHSNRTVKIRRPCVTTTYLKDGDPEYHVDLAIYAKGIDGKLYLAFGKEHSDAEHRSWSPQDPKGLQDEVINRFSEEDRKQFRRVIRYLKRWRNLKFRHNSFISIGITVAGYHWFVPVKNGFSGVYDDHQALENLVTFMLNQFKVVLGDDGGLIERLSVRSPVEPWTDLLEKMTGEQMVELKEKLKHLQTALQDAKHEADRMVACKSMVRFFGKDFPVPDAESEKAEKVENSVIGTGNSA